MLAAASRAHLDAPLSVANPRSLVLAQDDAAEAIDNMNNAELNGRVLKVNLSKPDAMKGGHRPGATPPPWFAFVPLPRAPSDEPWPILSLSLSLPGVGGRSVPICVHTCRSHPLAASQCGRPRRTSTSKAPKTLRLMPSEFLARSALLMPHL